MPRWLLTPRKGDALGHEIEVWRLVSPPVPQPGESLYGVNGRWRGDSRQLWDSRGQQLVT